MPRATRGDIIYNFWKTRLERNRLRAWLGFLKEEADPEACSRAAVRYREWLTMENREGLLQFMHEYYG